MSTPSIALKLAQKLRKLRVKHGLTQEQTAERSDLPIRYYQKLESKSPYAMLFGGGSNTGAEFTSGACEAGISLKGIIH